MQQEWVFTFGFGQEHEGCYPYTGKEAGRGDNYVQGQSDGAELCATSIAERVTPYERSGS